MNSIMIRKYVWDIAMTLTMLTNGENGKCCVQ